MNDRAYGMAPTPQQMERIKEARAAAGLDNESEQGQFALRHESFPDGVKEGTPLGLDQELREIVYSLHWQFQKQIFDIVQAAIGHNPVQFPVVRKLIMDISTAQVKTQLRMIQKRFSQEMEKDGKENVGSRFERPAPGDRGSDGGPKAEFSTN
jgi:hypothetical protein